MLSKSLMQPSLGGLRKVLLGLEHRRPHRQLGHLRAVEQRAGAGVVARRKPGQLFAVRALHGDVLAPRERCRRQRHTEQCDHRAQHHRRPAQPRPQRHDRGRNRRCAIPERILDVLGRQPRQHAGDCQHPGALEEAGAGVPGVGQPEDQQRPVPQVQRVGHRPERHERRRRQQPVRGGQPAAGVRIGQPVGGRQDEQHRGADRHQRPRSRELLDAVDQRAACQDRRQ